MPTPERIKELLPVITAFAEGKQIQFRHKHQEGWEDNKFGEGLGFYDDYDYRIKPEKKVIELWVNVYDECKVAVWFSKGEADFHAVPRGRNACLHIRQEYEEGEGLR